MNERSARTRPPGAARRIKRRRPRQLPLKTIFGRGGVGRGQGRRKGKSGRVPHRSRPFLDKNHPVHVSTRVVGGLPSLRGRRLWAAVRRGFVYGCTFGESKRRPALFRIVHFSVQGEHIHLLCEARDRRALSRGIQGFKIRVARAINAALGGRRGRVFADRYHERLAPPTPALHQRLSPRASLNSPIRRSVVIRSPTCFSISAGTHASRVRAIRATR